MSQKSSSDFKTLKRHWYQRLKNSGFEDIESEGGYLLRPENPYFVSHISYTVFLINSSYYRRAAQFFHHFDWKNKEERDVWELHAEGISYREIACRLRHRYRILNKDRVQKIVERIHNIMKDYHD